MGASISILFFLSMLGLLGISLILGIIILLISIIKRRKNKINKILTTIGCLLLFFPLIIILLNLGIIRNNIANKKSYDSMIEKWENTRIHYRKASQDVVNYLLKSIENNDIETLSNMFSVETQDASNFESEIESFLKNVPNNLNEYSYEKILESPTISYNYGDVTVELDGYYIFTKDNSTIYLYFSGFSESDKDKNKLGLKKIYLQSDKAKILEIEAKNDFEYENNFLGVKDDEYYSIVFYPELKKNSELIIKDHENIICHIDVNEEFNVKNIDNYPYRFVDYNINPTQEELIKAFESSDNVNDIISLFRNPNTSNK